MNETVQNIKETSIKFRNEIRKHMTTAITAALGFLVALSWRTPIQNSIKQLVEYLGVTEDLIFYEYLSAILITLIAVFSLMLISKWEVKK